MGGKSGKVAAEKPVDFITMTDIGTESGSSKTFDQDTAAKEKTIAKKKLGTRGLQIPLAADASTTDAATTGVQI